jgi:DnaJ-class molecular chaperone
VPTLKGRVVLTIAPGTQGGKRIRLAGQGMPTLSGDERGDLYVRTRVVLPTHLTDEARQAARRFLELVHQPDPRAR